MRERLLDRPGPADSLKQIGCAVKLQAPLFAVLSGKLRVFFNSELKGYGSLSAINYQEALSANRQDRGAVRCAGLKDRCRRGARHRSYSHTADSIFDRQRSKQAKAPVGHGAGPQRADLIVRLGSRRSCAADRRAP
jgi:hypothetical protein